MVYQRQMGEPIQLDAALPKIGAPRQSYDYDEAIRRRLGTIDAKGRDQTLFANQQAAARQQAAYKQALSGAYGTYNGGQGVNIGPGGKWLSPLAGNFKPTFEYGRQYKNGGRHLGIDFAAPRGTHVLSPYGATVVDTGFQKGGFGNHIRVKFDNGTYGIFGHLQDYAKGLTAGQKLRAGQLLGYVGSTGNSTGNHLHFETRYSLYDSGTSFNPGSWFGW